MIAAVITLTGETPGGEALGEEGDRGHVESHVRSLLDDPTFQTEWPTGEEAHGSRGSGGSGGRRGGRDRRPLQEGGGHADAAGGFAPEDLSRPRGGAAIAKTFLYMMVAVLAGTVAFALANALGRHRRLRTRLDPEHGGEAPAPSLRGPADSDLEALLRDGRLAEAVHLLLQRTLARLESRPGRRLARSLTSREVLRRLESSEREPFAILVEAVERSLFGGMPVTRAEYERCADAFARLSGRGATA